MRTKSYVFVSTKENFIIVSSYEWWKLSYWKILYRCTVVKVRGCGGLSPSTSVVSPHLNFYPLHMKVQPLTSCTLIARNLVILL